MKDENKILADAFWAAIMDGWVLTKQDPEGKVIKMMDGVDLLTWFNEKNKEKNSQSVRRHL